MPGGTRRRQFGYPFLAVKYDLSHLPVFFPTVNHHKGPEMPGSSTMLFESTTLLLRRIVDSLEAGDESEWDDHLEYGNQSIYELFQMSRPERRTHIGNVTPLFERASRAIPHVKLMNRAIRQHDRATAIKWGRAAVSEMNGTEHPIASADKTETVVKPAPRVIAIARKQRKTAARHSPAAQRKSARS